MAEIISDFFQVTGADITIPGNFGELIPYFANIFIGVCIVSATFRVLGKIIDMVLGWTRWHI